MAEGIERVDFELGYDREPTRHVRGRVHRPDAAGELPWVLVLHGFKGFHRWGFFPLLCDRLAERGVAAVAFDTSGSGVGPDGETFSDLEAFRRDTLSRQLEDVERVRDLALDGGLGPLSATRRALFGHSRGGGVAVVHASEDEGYRAVATWAALDGFDRWDEALKELWRRTGELRVLNARTGQELPMGVCMLEDFERNAARFDVLACAARLESPLLLVHGSEDPVVPVASGRALHAAAPRAEPFALIEGEGHTLGATHPLECPGAGLERALDTTVSWLARRLHADAHPGPDGA
ncbi:MAG TPA: prolyl oligopeptidase family serine peptidase [Planctomycetota bacterium]|nr:prolyl oligopeptidase family serine peptidase [Planctomycetota bacterium]